MKILNLKLLEYPKKYIQWYGTDVLKLVMFPPGKFIWKFRIILHRIFWKLVWNIFDMHYINTVNLKKGLIDFGISEKKIEVKPVPHNMAIYSKKDHNKFTILFFVRQEKSNQKYKDWIYGQEYLEILKRRIDCHWIVVDGTYDMAEVYPYVDLYIKISQTIYNDLNRISKECLLNKIDVIHFKAYQDNIEDLVKWINIKKDIWLIKRKKK